MSFERSWTAFNGTERNTMTSRFRIVAGRSVVPLTLAV
jgi:hypothetical protein